VRVDDVRTFVAAHDDLDLAALAGAYADLEDAVRAALAREGFGREDQRVTRAADLRYAGQAFEVPVPAPDGPVDAAFAAATLAAFHGAHRRRYGYAYADDPTKRVEWVNLRATGSGPIATPALPRLSEGDGHPERARIGTRPVRFALQTRPAGEPAAGAREPGGDRAGWIEAALYDRAGLLAGDVVAGPAVIEEFGSTVPLPDGFTARVDPFANLVLERG
jgi:N-methylhydantoinase A